MIITERDIKAFEKLYDNYISRLIDFDDISLWLSNNPHILLAADFTCYSTVEKNNIIPGNFSKYHLVSNYHPVFRQNTGLWVMPTDYGDSKNAIWKWATIDNLKKIDEYYKFRDSVEKYKDVFDINVDLLEDYMNGEVDKYIYDYLKNVPDSIINQSLFYRKEIFPKCKDYWHASIENYDLEIFNSDTVESKSFLELYNNLKKYIDNPVNDDKYFISSKIWTKPVQIEQYNYLSSTTIELIHLLQEEHSFLEDVSWKQLEDIVAELFRKQGMEIFINKKQPQGGRDIIGRYTIGNEIFDVAIEVKHRKVLGSPEVATFLKQNEIFPSLFLVTSGRFSAGALQDSLRPENKMRLKLYDGVAINSLIKSYKS
jgi:hypothetical protein